MKIRLFTIPNIITLCNLLCGVVALRYILIDNNLVAAFWLVIAAAIFDFLDGFMARLLKSYSAVGKELDSLADMVSFGVVPAAVVYIMLVSMDAPIYVALIAPVIALGSALRLAKFNVDESQSTEFEGMPTPANALFFVALGWMYQNNMLAVDNVWVLAVVSLLMAWLLISPIRMFALKFKSYALKGNKLRYGFVVGSLVALVAFSVSAIPVIIFAYVAVSTVSHIASPKRVE